MFGEDATAERLSGVRATADIFNVLGLTPLIGQFFTAENHSIPNDKVLVLTQSFWETHYREDPGVIGKTVRLDGETFTIVGVAPRAFEAFNAARARFVRPMSWNPANVNPNARHGNNPQLFARLKPGVTLGQAQAEADTIERRFYDAGTPQVRTFLDRAGHKIAVRSVQLERVQPMRTTLYMLQGGVILVLLTGCVNVANLLLARANARRAELAVRSALGATRGVIARQLLLEGALVTALGTALGIAVAAGAHVGLQSLSRPDPARRAAVRARSRRACRDRRIGARDGAAHQRCADRAHSADEPESKSSTAARAARRTASAFAR